MKLASKAIILNNGKYLLQHRDNKKNIYSPDCWGLFGGMADDKETPEQCLIREVKEELSINCEIHKKIHQCLNNETGILNIFFLVFTKDKISQEKLKEGQNLGWFSEKEIKKLKTTWDIEYFLKYKEEKKK